MKPEHYKSIRKGKPKRKGKTSISQSQMLAAAQKWKPITSPQSREIYSTKIEWVRLGKGASSQIDKISRRAERKRRA